MNWIDTRLGLTRDQWVVIGLMGSALACFVVLGVVQADEAEAAIGALISAPPQVLLIHAVLSHMDSRGPSLHRLFPCQQRSYSNTARTSPGLMSVAAHRQGRARHALRDARVQDDGDSWSEIDASLPIQDSRPLIRSDS